VELLDLAIHYCLKQENLSSSLCGPKNAEDLQTICESIEKDISFEIIERAINECEKVK
jgi:aryl-alcohol dehydrogenase-like predicted oxidoreductase